MGFQDMPEVVHKAASAKGGRVRVKKGLGAMSDEKRRAIQSLGGKAKHGVQEQVREDDGRLADIPEDEL